MSEKNILDSRVLRAALAFLGYYAAMSFLSAVSRGAWYYLYNTVGFGIALYNLTSYWIHVPANFAASLLIAVLLVYGVSCWRTAARKSVLRPVDTLSLLLVIFSGTCISVCLLINEPYNMGLFLWIISAVLYTAGILVYGELVRRLRMGTLFRDIIWRRFFRRFSPLHGLGLCVAVLITLSLLCLLITLPISMETSGGVFLTALFTFTLLMLTAMAKHLLALSAEYETANDDKLRAERFKAELITNVSHDIRTPLTSLISYVALLRRLPIQNAEFLQYTAVLEAKSARLKALIDDLMQASKASTGNLPVLLQPLALAEITGQIAGDWDDRFAERRLELVVRTPEEPVFALADSAHLWRVLENLFGNAAKYALPGTRVFAELSHAEGGVMFSLKNTSESPLESVVGELTEQFIRGERARQTEGNGLGLYIAKSLTELMGGRLDIRVSGDLFTAEVRLPAGDDQGLTIGS